jgi:hypothetical protein
MPPSPYSFQGDAGFIVEQYNDCAPFASFLPGIAGATGIPAWAFYVNRGQAIASFGVRNKDGAFLEFFPADKAYQLTACRGFRTFLKITQGGKTIAHEPFQRGLDPAGRQRMTVQPHEVSVEEIHPGLGLGIRADLFTLAQAPLAGLVRRVEIRNESADPMRVEIVDGLPQVLPYGLNQWCVKFMSRTIEAYMQVEGLAENAPFYRLKVLPTDSPQVERVEAGHCFAGFLGSQRAQAVVDAEKIFGLAGDFSRPERFFDDAPLDFAAQVQGNRNPSAFQALSLELAPGASRVFYGLYGHAASWAQWQAFLAGIGDAEAYFEEKRAANRDVINTLTQRAFTATAQPLFDAYARQCYLDNGLRGGFSVAVPGGARLHLYGRKHGDLERDYNDFLLQDSRFSQGNGDFRDVLQNRRTDIFFDPALDARNIHYFFNLIQPDGYNPQILRNSQYRLSQPHAFAHLATRFPKLAVVLSGEFKYAQLWEALQAEAEDPAAILQDILQAAEEIEDAEFDRGYWSDHWSYLVDLLESYAAIFPERVAGLFQEQPCTFFDPTHFVRPRAEKYLKTPQGIRQYGAVQARPDKLALIAGRPEKRYQVRAQHGTGEIVKTPLLGKILTLIANKLASLDPCGIGVEMEADRPGWCDALNGLPGLLGSAVNETIELKRLADFTLGALAQDAGEIPLPVELAEFVNGLQALLQTEGLSAMDFWRASHELKEAYREQVFMGFAGAQHRYSVAAARGFLQAASKHLAGGIALAKTPQGGIVTYYAFEAEAFREDENGQVEILRFRSKPLPWFLEGFVHALRIASPIEAKALYQAARDSDLFDPKLGMFRLNAPLGEHALELGRIGVFNYGWLENGSIFLHMHYKFVLEMARRGLIEEFYAQLESLLVPFRDPSEYRRNPIENASFLVCSGFAPDPREHGRGCVARLSGSTVEFLHLWFYLFLGAAPFACEHGKLRFRPSPSLAAQFFSHTERRVHPFGEAEEILPPHSAACAFLGHTLLVYINSSRQDTFGPQAVQPRRYRLYAQDGAAHAVEGEALIGAWAEALRLGRLRRVEVVLEA